MGSLFNIDNVRSTSILDGVKIKDNELRPPTLTNMTTKAENQTDNGGSDKYQPSLANSTQFGKFVNQPDYENGGQQDDSSVHLMSNGIIVGRVGMDLPGLTQENDNLETLLGYTIADAFLMNSWEDTQVRYRAIFCNQAYKNLILLKSK